MTDLLSRLSAETGALRTRLEVLTRQASTGRRADRLGDQAPDVPRAVSIRAEMARREVYGRAMDQAVGRIEATQVAMGRMRDIAREFRTEVAMTVNLQDAQTIQTIRNRARAALNEVGHLMNTRHAGEYVFGGSDLARPPVPAPTALMDTQMGQDIAAAVATLSPTNGAAVAAQTRTIATDDDTPFSAFVTGFPAGAPDARRAVPVAEGEVVPYGIYVDRNTLALSTGDTTGSWSRDLLRNLMTLASLDPAQATTGDGLVVLMDSVREGFTAAQTALGEEAASLGFVQRRIEDAKTRHETLNNVLERQLAGITDVDMAETLTRLQTTRTALEASYRALGSLTNLSLANFLR